jgi:hypothetical protein
MQMRLRTLSWGLLATLLMCASVSAQPKKGDTKPAATAPSKETKDKKDKVKNFDFNALDLNGRMRTPQLLYFLERANEELERASLEKRSFIPTMVKSVEEERL